MGKTKLILILDSEFLSPFLFFLIHFVAVSEAFEVNTAVDKEGEKSLFLQFRILVNKYFTHLFIYGERENVRWTRFLLPLQMHFFCRFFVSKY